MNGKKLWIQFWNEKTKQRKKNNCIKGLSFLRSYKMSDASLVLAELCNGLEMSIAGKSNSGYKVIMPNNEKTYRRIRLANHPFESNEWSNHEFDGLPNTRYSIFIYNARTCPQFANQSETDWRAEYSDGVPVYEKGFNEDSLNTNFSKLIRILIQIYNGGMPQPTNMPLKIDEVKEAGIMVVTETDNPLKKALLLIERLENLHK